MSVVQRKLYSSVAALVRKRRKESEKIWHWSEFHKGGVTVHLIHRQMERACAWSVKRFGRGAGCGRTLTFRKVDGRCTLVGEGRWIS
jgi:hypothetical protein